LPGGLQYDRDRVRYRSTVVSRREQAVLLARTVRHLRPIQIAHRARLRAQLGVFGLAPLLVRVLVARRPSRVGWPEGFVPLELRLTHPPDDAEFVASGTFRFLGEERSLGNPPDWNRVPRSRLWRFSLHGFEWAFALATYADRQWAGAEFRRLWSSWRTAIRPGLRDAWAPYVASLRAWALVCVFDQLVRGSRQESAFVNDLALHAGFVRSHLELDIRGNHLVKNLKALLGLGVFLGDNKLARFALRRLKAELRRQVLADGGHYERSPSYHCQVLGDLIDCRELAEVAGLPAPREFDRAIASMRQWLGTILLPDGDVPLLNDCTLVGREKVALLEPTQPPESPLIVLDPSGYAVARPDSRAHLVLDVGPPCPPELPAHAHADCLSFELAVDGARLVVDSGTSTYDPGPRRQYERSTNAHNTVEVDGQDQTEVWGVFRAARRAMPTLESADLHGDRIEVSASHDGYRRLPGKPVHRRTWRVSARRLIVSDEVLGEGRHRAVGRLHLRPGVEATTDTAIVRAEPLRIRCSEPVVLESGMVATGFGQLWPTNVVTTEVEGDLPLRVTTEICFGEPTTGDTSAGTTG
jgi:uncharacterized heparinase superfamily protein